jgi:SAM-dependent methyltransferase
MYDYYLGGKDNFPADREAAEQVLAAFPDGRIGAQQNRAFMHRAVRYLAGELGIGQFLDIGTGIPTRPNLHEVAQQIIPEARVVYADNDPIVLAHARALLTSNAAGRTAYLDVDLHDVEKILASDELAETIDLTKPVVLSLVAILHFFPDDQNPYGIVRRLLDPLPAGSHLIVTHATADHVPSMAQMTDAYHSRGIPAQARSADELARFFEGLDMVEPGIQLVNRWRPAPDTPTEMIVPAYGGVGRKN